MKLLREPLLHFALLGAALFVGFGLTGDRTGPASDRIVVTQGHIEHLATGFTRTWQRPPTTGELEALIQDFIRDEVYYREALALGIEHDDTVIRRRLRQKMEFLVEEAALDAPSDEELRSYLHEHPDPFRLEPRFAFRHIHLSRDRRGDAAERDARELLARLAEAGSDVDAAALGDPLMLPDELALASKREVARLFGDAFATRLEDVEPGKWGGPVESGYGLHLVFVRERVDGRLPDLSEVRDAVEREWMVARRKATVEAAYQRLRERYTVAVERPEGTGGAVARLR